MPDVFTERVMHSDMVSSILADVCSFCDLKLPPENVRFLLLQGSFR